MRLLLLTSRLPYPPNRGDRLRVYNFIHRLSKEHELHLVSFIANESEREYIAVLNEFCKKVSVLPMSSIRSAITVGMNIWRKQPLQTLYYRSAAMQALIDNILAESNFDAVYVHLFRMADYVAKRDDVYRIIDLTDVISQELIHSMPYRKPSSRILYAIESPRIEQYERWVAEHFEEIWLISEHDRSVLDADCQNANIQVVRNGVDTENLYPANNIEIPNSIIFVGHMGVFHNIDAATFLANDIFPLVLEEFPEAQLKIVGAAPDPQVTKLAIIPGVEVPGFEPDLNTTLNKSTVFVAPLRFAAGVQNKVLEAMATARPVVTTNLVNNGLGAQAGRDLLTADTPDEFSAAIQRLFRESELRYKIGLAGLKFVRDHYSWNFVASRLKTIQKQLN